MGTRTIERKARRKLNQFAISQELGSTMKQVPSARFGRFNLHRLESIAAAELCHDTERRVAPSKQASILIVKCFEDIREGLSPDHVLADPSRAARFASHCKSAGVEWNNEAIFRKLLAVRKNPSIYGIRIKKTEQSEVLVPDILENFIDAAEFALMKLRYTAHASIDDILVVPSIGKQYDHLCSVIAPGYRPLDYRLAALHIRKTRYLAKNKKKQVSELDETFINKKLNRIGSLSKLNKSLLPEGPGLFTLEHTADGRKFVYTAVRETVADNVLRFKDESFWNELGGNFWRPSLDDIEVRACESSDVSGASLRMWELRLIQVRSPLFNLPVAGGKVA